MTPDREGGWPMRGGSSRQCPLRRWAVGVLCVVVCILAPRGGHAQRPPHTTGDEAPACLAHRGIVILVEFPDVRPRVERRYAYRRFFVELDEYVREMSYGRACIQGDVTERWYTLPHPVSHYRISPRNLEVDQSRVLNLIRDSLDAADKEVVLSKYSFVALFLGASREEYGMIGLCGYPGMLGWSFKESLKTRSGQMVQGGVAIFSFQAHLGTLFHDVAHILGGIKDGKRVMPCLYDHDLQARAGPLREVFLGAIVNMGLWDPMSCHYNKWHDPPPGMCAWTRMRMNWIDPSKIQVIRPGQTEETTLGPLGDRSSEVLVVKIPLSPTTYYLVENRQPMGFDRYLPGSGVLISYADDTVAECRKGKAPVRLMNADPNVPRLEGAAFDIGKKSVFVDREHRLKIQLLERMGNSYKVSVGAGVE